MNEPRTTTRVVKKVSLRRTLGIIAASALALTGIGLIATSASATGGYDGPTQVVHAKALDQSCPTGTTLTGAHFVITQVVPNQSDEITVTISGDDKTVPLEKTSGKTAHYTITGLSADDTVDDATAVVPADWGGQFNLSHLICGGSTTPPTTTTTPPTSTTTSTEHKLGLSLSVEGCVGGEQTAVVVGKLTGMVDSVDYTANQTPDTAPLPNPVDEEGNFQLLARSTGLHTVTVKGSDGSSISDTVNVGGCPPPSTTTTTTPPSSTTTGHTTGTPTGTNSSSSSTPPKHHTTSPTKTNSVPVPVATTSSPTGYLPAAHTGGTGNNWNTQLLLGAAALIMALVCFWMAFGGRLAFVTRSRPSHR